MEGTALCGILDFERHGTIGNCSHYVWLAAGINQPKDYWGRKISQLSKEILISCRQREDCDENQAQDLIRSTVCYQRSWIHSSVKSPTPKSETWQERNDTLSLRMGKFKVEGGDELEITEIEMTLNPLAKRNSSFLLVRGVPGVKFPAWRFLKVLTLADISQNYAGLLPYLYP